VTVSYPRRGKRGGADAGRGAEKEAEGHGRDERSAR
jgi:hypothetical protein